MVGRSNEVEGLIHLPAPLTALFFSDFIMTAINVVNLPC